MKMWFLEKEMKVVTRILIVSIFLLGLLGSSVLPVFAQEENPLTVDVDRTDLGDNETLTLTVTVRLGSVNLNTPKPELPQLEDFNVISSGTSSQISIVNSVMSTTAVYTYRLQPLHSGELQIGPVSLTVSGETYQSDPITINVYESGTQPPGSENPAVQSPNELSGQDFYIEAEVDKTTPYQGQAVLYTFRLYQAVEFNEQPTYSPPDFTGFWAEKQDGQNQFTSQLAGRTYRITELQTLLFPNEAGEITIKPAGLYIPAGFFSSGGTLSTDPLTLQVKPLPEGAPQGFNGAVGQFNLNVTADTLETRVNEPLTLTITLTGTGNLNNLSDPVWPEIEGMRFYDSNAERNTHLENGQLSGSLVYERLLVPLQSGEFDFPALNYVYFNPQSGQYETTSSQPLHFSVAEGDPQAVAAATPYQNGTQKEDVELLASDIRYLKPAPDTLAKNPASLAASKLYWLAWLFPLLLLGGNWLWQRREDLQQRDPARFHYTRAYQLARKALAAAQKSDQPDLATARVVHDYLSAKLGQKTTGMTLQALSDLLNSRRLEPTLVQRCLDFLKECEHHRFAPTQDPAAAGRLLEITGQLIGELEKAL